ncbi:hypothetical protein [Lactococcus termiticola]|uniref:Uncharacterized protein n=1 Tax=Lactococcus termiticola TaxID=2169526 RepID=A0A2R5HJN9_9LACT|nr:hypothetical protein [Lactococcus termiticola]GBG96850.1 hypothetical protein NtB2_00975 [Lactococcus termiticola]
MGLEDLTKGLDLGNLGDLGEKAQDLMGNVPDDMKNQASGMIDELTEKLPDGIEDQAKGAIDGLKDQFGL